MPAKGSGRHCPLQHTSEPPQSKKSKQALPATVVLVVGPPTTVLVVDDVVVVTRARRRPRGPQTPPRQTRSNSPASMQATSFVQ